MRLIVSKLISSNDFEKKKYIERKVFLVLDESCNFKILSSKKIMIICHLEQTRENAVNSLHSQQVGCC